MTASRPRLPVLHNNGTWLPITENWLYTQARFLPDPVEVHIVCYQVQHAEQFRLPRTYAYDEQPLWKRAIRRVAHQIGMPEVGDLLHETIRKREIQVLHSHFAPTGCHNLAAVQRTSIKHIVTFYGYDVNRLPSQDPRWVERYHELFQQVDRVLCEGQHMAMQIARLGCPQEKIHTHHLGIDLDQIPFRPRKWHGQEPFRVLIAASFREKKGIPDALDALGNLARDIDIQISVIGDAPDSEEGRLEKRRIHNTVAKHNLESRVQFLGYQPRAVMLEEAYSHHVFLSPSVTAQNGDTEGGAPIAISEMLATGMPVIATTHCDIPEAVGLRQQQLLVEEHDVAGLTDKLYWLLSNPQEWEAITTASRQHLENEYSARTQGQRLAKHYVEVCASQR